MDFQMALQAARQGNLIRRRGWAEPSVVVRYVRDPVPQYQVQPTVGEWRVFLPSAADMIDEDWIVLGQEPLACPPDVDPAHWDACMKWAEGAGAGDHLLVPTHTLQEWTLGRLVDMNKGGIAVTVDTRLDHPQPAARGSNPHEALRDAVLPDPRLTHEAPEPQARQPDPTRLYGLIGRGYEVPEVRPLSAFLARNGDAQPSPNHALCLTMELIEAARGKMRFLINGRARSMAATKLDEALLWLELHGLEQQVDLRIDAEEDRF